MIRHATTPAIENARKMESAWATVTSERKEETYVGLTSTTFKARLANHQQLLRSESKRAQTELSKYVWGLKDEDKNFEIKWDILQRALPYSNVNKKCNLCIAEKYIIICKPNLSTLNKRSDIMFKCRHRDKCISVT